MWCIEERRTMKTVLIAAVTCALALAMPSARAFDDPQTEAFKANAIAGCLYKQLNAAENQTVAPATIYRFCVCSAGYLSHVVTLGEMVDGAAIRNGSLPASIGAKSMDAFRFCVAGLK
jgi:hypothetical protein